MSTSELSKAYANHNRKFENLRFVYPVISRRAEGLSIGINCVGVCSFDCIYCQVCKNSNVKATFPNVKNIISELKYILSIYKKTKLAEHFPGIAEKNRLLKDIALSGDGEPTLYPHFEELCAELAAFQKENDIPKLILITNAVRLPNGLEYLCKNNGEIWGKLDAGTDDFLQFIDRPQKKVSIAEIENNLKSIVSKFPLRIQTMLCEAKGRVPSETEIESYIQIVQRIYEINPKKLLSVQLYSPARQSAENSVQSLPRDFLERVKNILQNKISSLCVEVF
ncbi:MAG: radical SAM protein [Fibromonadaceae bacterium]|jgi:wyosine [tRNA(Phe)-imidazoG37] synthetase (radical SAM superfamily)|nr:radical SAM protein [Fibromonadaceae bacterium]